MNTVFTFLQDGVSDDGSDEKSLHDQNFLQNLRSALHQVMKNFEDLEETVNKYPLKIPNDKVPHLANLSQLHRDPDENTYAIVQEYSQAIPAFQRKQGFKSIKPRVRNRWLA